MRKKLYIVIGPTACGKTSFAIELARHLKTEIVSADSRQIFKEMNIGVARPEDFELQAIKHHLIATWSVEENYNVARYEKEALTVINNLFSKYDNVVLCGGSGMYVNAVVNGIDDIPDTPPEIRNRLQEELRTNGLNVLLNELKAKDEKYFSVVDTQNPRRVLRALEVIRLTGKPFSDFRTNTAVQRDFDIKIIGLERKREELIQRINTRVDIMIDKGLVDEARSLVKFQSLNALSTVGYRELFDFFDGKTTLSEAVELIKIHTRQYAKRQITWFRKTPNVHWYNISSQQIDLSQL